MYGTTVRAICKQIHVFTLLIYCTMKLKVIIFVVQRLIFLCETSSQWKRAFHCCTHIGWSKQHGHCSWWIINLKSWYFFCSSHLLMWAFNSLKMVTAVFGQFINGLTFLMQYFALSVQTTSTSGSPVFILELFLATLAFIAVIWVVHLSIALLRLQWFLLSVFLIILIICFSRWLQRNTLSIIFG